MKTILFFITITLVLFGNSQTFTGQNVLEASVSSNVQSYQLNSAYDTSFSRNVSVELTSLSGVDSIRIEITKTSDNSTVTDSTLVMPSNDITTENIMQVGRLGNKVNLNMGYFSLSDRFRIRFFLIDSGVSEEKVFESEF